MAVHESIMAKLNYAADPGIEMLLDKEKLAIIKVHNLDTQIRELHALTESLELQKKLLVKEYKIR